MFSSTTVKKIMSVCNRIDINLKNNLDISKIKIRPNSGNGVWLLFLVPACLCSSLWSSQASAARAATALCSLGLCLASLFFVLFTSLTPQNVSYRFVISKGWAIPGLTSCCFCMVFLNKTFQFSLLSGFSTSFSFRWLLSLVQNACPLSFSVGEAILVTQTIVLFLYHSTLNLCMSYQITPDNDYDIIVVIVQSGLVAVCTVVLALYCLSLRVDLARFCLVVGSVIFCMLLALHVLLKQSPVLWILMFLIGDIRRLTLIAYWAAASALAALAVVSRTSTGEHASTAQRKVFHVLAVLVYLPGLALERPLMLLASGIAMAGLIALETVRKLNLGTLSKLLNDGFDVFADEKDVGGVALTPLYLLVGVAAPLALSANSKGALLPAISGLLSVGIGDSAASFFGSLYGHNKWPGSNKSIEGVVANVASQFLTVSLLMFLGYVEQGVSMLLVFLAVITNALVELTTDQVDNLTLPLITFVILNLSNSH